MNKVISAGIIIYQNTEEGPKFLLLYHGHGYWNFPKGKLEKEERSWQAAMREVKEETGLESSELKFRKDFKAYERFTFGKGSERTFKVVILFLAETRKKQITISWEHEGFGWFLFRDARRLILRYKENLKILQSAYDYLRQKAPKA